jgi:hypothetical protein
MAASLFSTVAGAGDGAVDGAVAQPWIDRSDAVKAIAVAAAARRTSVLRST